MNGDQEFAWFRLHGAEQAALIVLFLAAAGLAAGNWLRTGAPPAPRIAHLEPAPARIYVNRAGVAELSALPGIGPRKAQRIIEARAAAPLLGLDDLSRAAGGVPQASLARMKPFVSFEQ